MAIRKLCVKGKPNFMQLKNKQNDMIKNWVAKNAGYKLIRSVGKRYRRGL